MFYTYVLQCESSKIKNKIFYVGSSDNLRQRISSHKNKRVATTKSFDKIELVYYEACLNKTDAIQRENQLKTGFGRGYVKRRLKNYLKDAELV